MRYQFEYFYIYNGRLLMSETIEKMEELLDLAALDKQQAGKGQSRRENYSPRSSATASSSR